MPALPLTSHRRPAVLVALLILSACVRLPASAPIGAPDVRARPAVLPATLRILTWNVHKERAASFTPRLRRYLRRGVDLVLLQEACLDGVAPSLLATDLDWRIAPSWAPRDRASDWLIGCGRGESPTGVLTAAVASPLSETAIRTSERELGLTPKTALLTEYALRGRRDTLLVANVHALAFQSLGVFRRELGRVVDALRPHRGPLLVAGDFNTWTRPRRAALERGTRALGLRPVAFPPGSRSSGVGREPLDHVFQRGLRVRAGSSRVGDDTRAGISDHNALLVTVDAGEPAAGAEH